MKSLRLLTIVFTVFAIANARAADSQKATAKASPSAKPSASPSATPDKSGLPDPVALVEGKKIKRAELETQFASELANTGHTMDSLTHDDIQRAYHYVLDEMIIDRLLRTRSASIKIGKDDVDKHLSDLKAQLGGSDADFADALKKNHMTLAQLKDNILVSLQQQKWIDSQIADKINVTEADAKSFYDKNPDQFEEPQTIRVSHILILVPKDATPDVAAEKEKLAKSTKDRITKGEDFAKVAGEVSEDPDSKSKGGDLVDYFGRGSIGKSLPEFEDAAFKLKKGEVSDPVKTKLGWHIIKVTDIKDAQTIAYADAKDKIIDYLKQGKTKEAVKDLLKNLRDKSDAKVYLPPAPKEAAADDSQSPTGRAPAPGADAQPPADQTAPATKELGAP